MVIPKSVRPDRMAENLDIFDFELTDDEMTRIAALDTGKTMFFDHHDPAMVKWLGGRRVDGHSSLVEVGATGPRQPG